VHIEEMVGALRKLGHEVVIVGPRAVETEQFGSDAGFVDALKKYLPRVLYEMMELAYSFVDYFRLRKAARIHNPDCIYERYNLFLLSGVWVAWRTGVPLLLEVNSPLYDERSKFGGIAMQGIARWTERTAWCSADHVLPVTRVLAARIQREGVPLDRITVVPNGINPNRFVAVSSMEAAKASLGLDGQVILGFVGFMREWHGLERVVDWLATTKSNNRSILFVGDGPARAALEQRAIVLGVRDHVRFTGVVGRDQIAQYIAAFDVALQPQVVEYASPLKLFEYLALGKAVVAPATPNIREILTDGKNAILFDPRDDLALSHAIERVCADDALRARLGMAARQLIDERGLTWDHNAQVVTDLFRQLGAAT